MSYVACTGVDEVCGRVFGREQNGSYAIQLCGFPGVIRVRPSSLMAMPIVNFSRERPIPVIVSISKFDSLTQTFYGCITEASSNPLSLPHPTLVPVVNKAIKRRLSAMVL
jgi:hypothetical protein